MEHKDNHAFNALFFKRIWKISKLLFPGKTSLPMCLFIFLLITSILDQYFSYYTGLISSKFYKVLVGKDSQGFTRELIIAIALILGKSVIMSTTIYTSQLLYVSWRQIITYAIHRLYFFENRYYKLNILDLSIDNPDQRITQDIDKMCDKMSAIVVKIIISPLTIAYYTYKTYDVTGYKGPLIVFGFFVLSTIVNKAFMSPIVKLYAKREKCEGDFRFKHMYVRMNSESIAFYLSDHAELLKSNNKLNVLIKTLQTLYNHEFPLSILVNFFNYCSAIISYIIIAIPLFEGAFDGLSSPDLTALISANGFVTIYLVSQFSLFIDLSIQVAELAGVTHRVSELIEKLSSLSNNETQVFEFKEKDPSNQESYNSALDVKTERNNEKYRILKDSDEIAGKLLFRLQDLTVFPPGEVVSAATPLISNLNLDLNKDQNVLITGSSSSGKTSLLRIIRGLWPPFSGSVKHSTHILPSTTNVMYLPQKPLLTDGTFLDQIIYPLHTHQYDNINYEKDYTILRWIELVGLSDVIKRFGGLCASTTIDWQDVLSPGEVQRVSFLRLFYHRPCFAVLDEATSAVSVDMEEILYQECQKLNITLLSVGHRKSLRKFHVLELCLQGNGEWNLIEI